MGKGGQGEASGDVGLGREMKEFEWSEVEKKTDRECRWLVIDDEVYNITSWSYRHPGGSKVIAHYAGQDATDAFKAFHNDLSYVKKFMKPIHIGSIKPQQRKVKSIEEDFRELRTTAEKMGLFKPSVLFYTLVLIHILVLEWAAWAVMAYWGTGWGPCLLSLALMTTVQAQVGWNQHDFGHLSVFNSTWWNHALHLVTFGIIKGASPAWWNHMHYQHHAKPNVMDKDPDIRLEALFVVGDQMPVEVAKKQKEGGMPYNWQNYYFFLIGPPLLFPVYFQIMLFRFIFLRKKWIDLAAVMIFFAKYIYLYVPLLGWGQATVFYFTFRCLESHWFTWVAQSNHIPMSVEHDKALPWLQLQLHATCNVTKSWFNDWFTGHLNFQIEHHLFPTMPRHNLYKMAPLVKSVCEKHDIPYVVKPLGQAFADIVRSLKTSGDLWQETYNTFHAT